MNFEIDGNRYFFYSYGKEILFETIDNKLERNVERTLITTN